MILQLRNENVGNHGSIPITIDYNVVAFLKKYGPMIPPEHKVHQTVSFLDVTVFRHTVVDWLHSKCGSFVC
ncbi:hypothetical protein TNCV_3849521 [Trichonephila clavipes]|nr:hypothetical protein TNCV_3849521 [Trichonephila clavipes]